MPIPAFTKIKGNGQPMYAMFQSGIGILAPRIVERPDFVGIKLHKLAILPYMICFTQKLASKLI